MKKLKHFLLLTGLVILIVPVLCIVGHITGSRPVRWLLETHPGIFGILCTTCYILAESVVLRLYFQMQCFPSDNNNCKHVREYLR